MTWAYSRNQAVSRGFSQSTCLSAESRLRRLTRRRLADSNRCTRLCRPLPSHSAKSPEGRSVVLSPMGSAE